MAEHTHIAHNHSLSSENRIHSDDVAQRFGFSGALVAGVQVFGHMSYPLSAALGDAWMRDSEVAVRFLKPAYDGDRLDMRFTHDAGGAQVDCENADGVLLATLAATFDVARPAESRLKSLLPGVADARERVEITMEAIELDVPFAPKPWQTTADENQRFAEQVGDDLALYRDGLVHPHLILHYANQALMARFVMPAWIHVGSALHFHRPLRVGDEVDIRAVPTEKWERKGHQFIKLLIAYLVDGEPSVEIEHTAIFNIAGNG